MAKISVIQKSSLDPLITYSKHIMLGSEGIISNKSWFIAKKEWKNAKVQLSQNMNLIQKGLLKMLLLLQI